MESKFVKELRFDIPENTDFWSFAEALSVQIIKTFRELRGEEIPFEVTVGEPDGSTFRGKDFLEARKALESHHFELSQISFHPSVKTSVDSEWESFADMDVYLFIKIPHLPPTLAVNISAETLAIRDALIVATDTFYLNWNAGLIKMKPAINSSSPAISLSTPTIAKSQHYLSEDTNPTSPIKIWLKRTWKDHLGLLIITVVAGLIIYYLTQWLHK